MSMKKMKRTRLMGCVLAVVMVISMMLSAAVSTSAAPVANQAVNDAKNGVVQIQVWYNDAEYGDPVYLQSGTGFLINNTTVVTCQHVVTAFSAEWYKSLTDAINADRGLNRTVEQVKACLELRVMVLRDVYVKATVRQASTEMDYAILTLAQPVSNRTPLKIRNSAELQQTEAVFALGFPGDIEDLKTKHDYDANDVTITSGNVNTVTDMSFTTLDGYSYNNVNCVESSALIIAGNSGGPLVDANGAVVGINAAGKTEGGTRNIAVASKQLIDVLKALGIEYTPAEDVSEPTTEPSAEATTQPSDEPTSAPTSAPTQAATDDDKAEKDDKDDDKAEGSLDITTIIIIAAGGAVVLILIIVLIVVAGGKKNAPAAPAAPVAPVQPVRPVAPVAPVAPVQPVRPAAPVTPGTTVLQQDAGATTVLGANAGATTVLSQNVNGGTLTRVSTNERVPVCSADFTVGRERNSVDYCINGNTNISRVHARFVVRDGKTFIIDNKAANGTFVNGVKSRPGQEIELNNGDAIMLADEKFEFNK